MNSRMQESRLSSWKNVDVDTIEDLCTLQIKSYLVDEKLELDDGRSTLVLTVALHAWTTKSEGSVSRKTQRHLQAVFSVILMTSAQLIRDKIWLFLGCFPSKPEDNVCLSCLGLQLHRSRRGRSFHWDWGARREKMDIQIYGR